MANGENTKYKQSEKSVSVLMVILSFIIGVLIVNSIYFIMFNFHTWIFQAASRITPLRWFLNIFWFMDPGQSGFYTAAASAGLAVILTVVIIKKINAKRPIQGEKALIGVGIFTILLYLVEPIAGLIINKNFELQALIMIICGIAIFFLRKETE